MSHWLGSISWNTIHISVEDNPTHDKPHTSPCPKHNPVKSPKSLIPQPRGRTDIHIPIHPQVANARSLPDISLYITRPSNKMIFKFSVKVGENLFIQGMRNQFIKDVKLKSLFFLRRPMVTPGGYRRAEKYLRTTLACSNQRAPLVTQGPGGGMLGFAG